MRRRTFTTEEANLTLPLVERVTRDIIRSYRELSRHAADYKILRTDLEPAALEDRTSEAATPEAATPESGELLATAKEAMSALSDEIDAYVAEMEEIGCEVKDLRNGTVDFPSEMDGRRVYLCWQIGEPRVEFWHEVTDGFQGRRPLPVTVPED